MIKLTLTQDAYLNGDHYEAGAKDKDGNYYFVFWDFRDDFDPDTDEDEGDACDWDKPIIVYDEENSRDLVEEGIEFEIA